MDKSSLTSSSLSTIVAIIVSFLIASAMNVYPFNTATASLRPMVLVMVLV